MVSESEKSKNAALVEKAGEEYLDWIFPSPDLLNPAVATVGSDDALLTDNAEKIRAKLGQFGINVAMHECMSDLPLSSILCGQTKASNFQKSQL